MDNYSEINLLIVGGIISLISTLVIYFFQEFIKWVQTNKGKLKIYKKTVYNKIDGSSWGVKVVNKGLTFHLPLWIEIHNNKNKNMILRNLNLYLYRQGQQVGNMEQINYYINNNSETIYFANEGAYSFLIKPNSIQRFDLYFTFKHDSKTNFDEIRLGYYNSKDKFIEYHLMSLENPWEFLNRKIDNDWSLLN